MKKIKSMLALIPALLISCAGEDVEKYIPPTPLEPSEPAAKVVYNERAKELYDVINQFYKVKTGATAGLFNENYPKASGDANASFLWPYDGYVSAIATLHKLGYDVEYTTMVDNFQKYYRTSGDVNVGGYGSATNGTSGKDTRFYDDNSIVGLDLVEAYNITKDAKYLDRCKQIVAFLESGEDDKLGGALWWNESEKDQTGNSNSNKPACANGFATLFLLNYYTVCPQAEKTNVLNFAKRLYNWVHTNLRDPEDGCYWNDKQVDGSINKTKWTYNTGAMISNGVLLYKITGEQSYIDHATTSAEGSYNYFVRPSGSMALAYPNHDPWFTIKLIKSYIDIEPYYSNASTYINTFITFLDYAYDNARYTNGLYYENWTGATGSRDTGLLMQDAALESLGTIALYKDEKLTENK